MPTDAIRNARETVDRAEREAAADEQERTSGAAKGAAARRMLRAREGGTLRRVLHDNGLSLVAFALFALALVGQTLSGAAVHNDERREHGQAPISLVEYLGSGAFLEATAENWESEFLQMGVFVVLTVFLYQRGSSESKRIEAPEAVDQRPEEARDAPDAPGPVRIGGFALTLYRHSLSLILFAMFLVAFALHAVGGASEYNADQRQHGGDSVTVLGYLATSRFWFESFQNWQSEFLSVGVLVVLTIWLREEGSPQSKPVAAGHHETGE